MSTCKGSRTPSWSLLQNKPRQGDQAPGHKADGSCILLITQLIMKESNNLTQNMNCDMIL